MALQDNIILDSGVVLSSGYITVSKAQIDYVLSIATIDVTIHKDVTAYNAEKQEVISRTHSCANPDFTTYFAESVLDDTGKTPLTQAYVWIKTLSIYENAIEV